MQKLRKLLEDVHLESEESSAVMRKKHQETINEMQDQVDIVMKQKQKSVSFNLLPLAF